jgi:hypothetical protein
MNCLNHDENRCMCSRFASITPNTKPMLCWMCNTVCEKTYMVDGDVACATCATSAPTTLERMTRVEIQHELDNIDKDDYNYYQAYREWCSDAGSEFSRKCKLYDSMNKQGVPSGG